MIVVSCRVSGVLDIFMTRRFFQPIKKPSWSGSYSSWIYNYLCNQCISPLTLWVQISLMARCTRYSIMW